MMKKLRLAFAECSEKSICGKSCFKKESNRFKCSGQCKTICSSNGNDGNKNTYWATDDNVKQLR